jgi:ADP-heptose:LPS heptosyltransferase
MVAYAGSALRRDFPEMEQHWATESLCVPVFDTNRLANRLVEVPRQRWKKSRMSPSTWMEQVHLYLGLRKDRFDIGFDFQGHSKTALLLRLAKPKVRWSMPATDALARRLNPCISPGAEGQHQVDRFYDLIRAWHPIQPTDQPLLPDYRSLTQPTDKPLLTIQTGGSFADKIVPIDVLSEVGRLGSRAGWTVRFLGAKGDPEPSPDAGENLVGENTLPQTFSLLQHSAVHLCGDTGTGHFAAGSGIPTIVVFTSDRNHPDRYAPVGPSSEVVRAYEDARLMDPQALWARVAARI